MVTVVAVFAVKLSVGVVGATAGVNPVWMSVGELRWVVVPSPIDP
jgi:hypothetical protein